MLSVREFWDKLAGRSESSAFISHLYLPNPKWKWHVDVAMLVSDVAVGAAGGLDNVAALLVTGPAVQVPTVRRRWCTFWKKELCHSNPSRLDVVALVINPLGQNSQYKTHLQIRRASGERYKVSYIVDGLHVHVLTVDSFRYGLEAKEKSLEDIVNHGVLLLGECEFDLKSPMKAFWDEDCLSCEIREGKVS